jgi:hypothetical protein
MNPNRGEQSNFEAPQPPQSPETEQDQEQAAEAPPARPEAAGQQAKQPALPAIPDDIPPVEEPVIAAPPQDLTAVSSSPHSGAADSDRIEPVWIDKIKQTAARTRDDPYIQSNEMSKIKAEYKLKRFDKPIKTDEAAV